MWFSEALKTTEANGWVLAQAPSAYAACRVVQGKTHWGDALAHDQAPGRWLVCEEPYSPIILLVRRSCDVAGMDAFRAAVQADPLEFDGAVLSYDNAAYGAALRFYADQSKPPELNGQPLNFTPKRVYDCPFIQGDWDSGIVVLHKNGRRTVLDFNRP